MYDGCIASNRLRISRHGDRRRGILGNRDRCGIRTEIILVLDNHGVGAGLVDHRVQRISAADNIACLGRPLYRERRAGIACRAEQRCGGISAGQHGGRPRGGIRFRDILRDICSSLGGTAGCEIRDQQIVWAGGVDRRLRRIGALQNVAACGCPGIAVAGSATGHSRAEGLLGSLAIECYRRRDSDGRGDGIYIDIDRGDGGTAVQRINDKKLVQARRIHRGRCGIRAADNIAVGGRPQIRKIRSGARSGSGQLYSRGGTGKQFFCAGIGHRRILIQKHLHSGVCRTAVLQIGDHQGVKACFVDGGGQRILAGNDIAVQGRPGIAESSALARSVSIQHKLRRQAGEHERSARVGGRRRDIQQDVCRKLRLAVIIGIKYDQLVLPWAVHDRRQRIGAGNDIAVCGRPTVGNARALRRGIAVDGDLVHRASQRAGDCGECDWNIGVAGYRGSIRCGTAVGGVEYLELILAGRVHNWGQGTVAGGDIAVGGCPNVGKFRSGTGRSGQRHGEFGTGKQSGGPGFRERRQRVLVNDYRIGIGTSVGGVGNEQGVGSGLIDRRCERIGAADDVAVGGRPGVGVFRTIAGGDAVDLQAGLVAVDDILRTGFRDGNLSKIHDLGYIGCGASVAGIGNQERVISRLVDGGNRRICAGEDSRAAPLIGEFTALAGCSAVERQHRNQTIERIIRAGSGERQAIVGVDRGRCGGGAAVDRIRYQQRIGSCSVYQRLEGGVAGQDIAVCRGPEVGERPIRAGSGAVERQRRLRATQRIRRRCDCHRQGDIDIDVYGGSGRATRLGVDDREIVLAYGVDHWI